MYQVKPIFLSTTTYPMWYNVMPPFVLLDPSLYPTYSVGTKRFYPMIFRNYRGYVPRYVYPMLEQPVVPPTYIPHYVGN